MFSYQQAGVSNTQGSFEIVFPVSIKTMQKNPKKATNHHHEEMKPWKMFSWASSLPQLQKRKC